MDSYRPSPAGRSGHRKIATFSAEILVFSLISIGTCILLFKGQYFTDSEFSEKLNLSFLIKYMFSSDKEGFLLGSI